LPLATCGGGLPSPSLPSINSLRQHENFFRLNGQTTRKPKRLAWRGREETQGLELCPLATAAMQFAANV